MTPIETASARSVTLIAQIACVKRELALRETVYRRRIASGKMSQALADREIEAMRAVLGTLEREANRREPALFDDQRGGR